MDKYVNGKYTYADERPCAFRKRAKLRKLHTMSIPMLMSIMHMREDMQRKRRAFLVRNGRA